MFFDIKPSSLILDMFRSIWSRDTVDCEKNALYWPMTMPWTKHCSGFTTETLLTLVKQRGYQTVLKIFTTMSTQRDSTIWWGTKTVLLPWPLMGNILSSYKKNKPPHRDKNRYKKCHKCLPKSQAWRSSCSQLATKTNKSLYFKLSRYIAKK